MRITPALATVVWSLIVITPNWTYIQHRTAPQSHRSHHYQQQVCDRLVVLLGPRARKAEHRHVRAESSSPIHRTSWVVVVVFFNCLPTSSSKPRDKAAQQCHPSLRYPAREKRRRKTRGQYVVESPIVKICAAWLCMGHSESEARRGKNRNILLICDSSLHHNCSFFLRTWF